MKIGRLAIGIFGLIFAVALLLRPAVLPDPGGGFELHAQILDHLDKKATADLLATMAFLEAIDPAADARPDHPNDWIYATSVVTRDGLQHFNAWQGGRVKSATWLLVSPASRYSART